MGMIASSASVTCDQTEPISPSTMRLGSRTSVLCGFTLIELLVAMSVGLLLLTMAFACIVAAMEFAGDGRDRIRCQQVAEFMASDIGGDILSGSSVCVHSDGRGVEIENEPGVVTYRFDGQSGTITRDVLDASGASTKCCLNPADMEITDVVFTDGRSSIGMLLSIGCRRHPGISYSLYTETSVMTR